MPLCQLSSCMVVTVLCGSSNWLIDYLRTFASLRLNLCFTLIPGETFQSVHGIQSLNLASSDK